MSRSVARGLLVASVVAVLLCAPAASSACECLDWLWPWNWCRGTPPATTYAPPYAPAATTVAPPFTPSANKIMPYVGGEPVKAQVIQPGYLFFYVALFFTVVHVAAMVIAIAPAGTPLALTLGYLALMVVGITILRWEQ